MTSPAIPYIESLDYHMALNRIEVAPADYVATLSDDELWDVMHPARAAWEALTGDATPVDPAVCASFRAEVAGR